MIGKDFINQPVFFRNTAGPMPRQIFFQWLRFADSVKRVPQYFGNQGINLAKYFFIFRSPLPVVIKSGFFKTDHRAAVCPSADCIACSSVLKETIFPRLMFSIAVSRCSRLAGELQRYSVSSCSRTVISMSRSGYASLKEVIKLFPSSLVLSLNTASIQHTIMEITEDRKWAEIYKTGVTE